MPAKVKLSDRVDGCSALASVTSMEMRSVRTSRRFGFAGEGVTMVSSSYIDSHMEP